MARTKYTVTFPAAKAGDQVTTDQDVYLENDSRNTTRRLDLNEAQTSVFYSDAASVTVSWKPRGGGAAVTQTVTSGTPTKTGSGLPNDWQPNTAYAAGSLVINNSTMYRAKTSFTSGATFAATNWEQLGSAAYIAPSKIAPAATGVAATDTAALQAAINATPAGGKLYIPAGTYLLNAALTVANHITIEGEAVAPTFTSETAAGSPEFPTTPFLAGTILKQMTAATDAVKITGTSIAVNLYNLGILFDTGIAGNTGHGINATPTQTYTTGHDMGVTDFVWSNVQVANHDGSHFAYYIVNPQYGEVHHARSWYGGGYCVVADGNQYSYGNMVWVNPYVVMTQAGSAGGYVHVSGATTPTAGNINLITYIRPQCNVQGTALASGTQPVYNDLGGAGIPDNITVVSCDFEGGAGNPFTPGKFTKFVGHIKTYGRNVQWTSFGDSSLPYLTGVAATAIGNNTLKALTTGDKNVALGGNALAAVTSGGNNTALGNIAGQTVSTNGDLTAVGAAALQAATGGSNTALGSQAAFSVTSGTNNVAVGASALHTSTGAAGGTAVGTSALYWLTGANNTAVGNNALSGNTGATGSQNVAVGAGAGVSATSANTVTTGSSNVFVGYNSGMPNTSQGNANVAVGFQALAGGTTTGRATAIGASTSASAAGSVAIGVDNAGTGASSATTNLIVLGTALHTTQIPGLPAFVASDKYLVVDSSGNIHKSALGPAS